MIRKSVIVVGAGISGMRSALSLADLDVNVYLVERKPYVGGKVAMLEKTFPTHDCALCLLEPMLMEVATNDNIDLITNSRVKMIEGERGDFRVTLAPNPWAVDIERCTDCGKCLEACDRHAIRRITSSLGMGPRGHRYTKLPQSPTYMIMDEECNGCKECIKACAEKAIVYTAHPEERILEAGSVILSPGFMVFDPSSLGELGYKDNPNVQTSLDLERMMSASGSHAGLVTRPSDGEVPRKVAFIQCVGSRDTRTNTYCSSVCCMAALKEAILLTERYGKIEPTIFHMDIRAFGKEYEDYYRIAKQQYKVKFVNSRVSDVERTDDNDLIVKFVDEGGRPSRERFDMVVLSVGIVPHPSIHALSKASGIELDEHDFIATDFLSPLSTSVDGIFSCGASLSPKDIPDSVCDARAAAGLASLAAGSRLNLTVNDEHPIVQDIVGDVGGAKIGVFLCACEDELASVIDIASLMDFSRGLPDVAHVEQVKDICHKDALQGLIDTFKEKGLDRMVIGACTPRLLEPLMKDRMWASASNPYVLEIANLREQCAWVHSNDRSGANKKARALIQMAVSKAQDDIPLFMDQRPVERTVLVLGGGLSGMIAARYLSKRGHPVLLVEKAAKLGGNLGHVMYLFEGDGDPQGFLRGVEKEVMDDPNVIVHLNCNLLETGGRVGEFRSRISGPDGEFDVVHGAVVLATGGVEYSPSEYLYGEDEHVITQSELEAVISKGELGSPKTVVMVQCVGSRTDEHPWCSRICCTVAVKNALKIKAISPGTEVMVLYKDMRTFGSNEDRYLEARKRGVQFKRYDDDRPPKVTKNHGSGSIIYHDRILGKKVSVPYDLLVLSAAIHPNNDNLTLSQIFKIPLSKDGFLLEAHVKADPVGTSTDGVFMCGLAKGPSSLKETMIQAIAAASEASALLDPGYMGGKIITASVDPRKCRGCARCEEVCEFSAISVVLDTIDDTERLVSKVDDSQCVGCGKCSIICCNKSISMNHFTTAQMQRIIQNALEGE